MAIDNTRRQNFMGPALTENPITGTFQIPVSDDINLVDLIKSAVASTGRPFPSCVDIIVSPDATDTSLLVEFKTDLLTAGFPVPHIPTGGGGHPSPLRLNLAGITNLFLAEVGGADSARVAIITYY